MSDALNELVPAAARRDPERTRRQILDAAAVEFADKGLGGARINLIAERAGANKRMIYHYFGSKVGLYLAVMERVYASIRAKEQALSLGDLAPAEAMTRLIRFTWRHFVEHPEFISLLNNENLHRARHIKGSRRIREVNSPLIAMIADILERGARAGVFRGGVDPVQLYISIAALGYFYLSNQHTLAVGFGRDLAAPSAMRARCRHIEEVVLGYLRPGA